MIPSVVVRPSGSVTGIAPGVVPGTDCSPTYCSSGMIGSSRERSGTHSPNGTMPRLM